MNRRVVSWRLLPPPSSLVSVLSLSTETAIIKEFTALRDSHRAIATPKSPPSIAQSHEIAPKVLRHE